MANHIAQNFARQGADAAANATSDHIARFWDPGMGAKIPGRLDESGHGVSAVAVKALNRLRVAAGKVRR